MRDVEGRVAFITGGGSGVGLGMAKAFVGAGMKVAIADIRADHLEQATAALDGDVHAMRLDVTDREAFAHAADETERVLGNVHVLCLNAGINLFNDITEATYQDWDWVLGVNLGGVVNGVVTFVPRIKAHGEGGHVVTTASMAAFVAGPGAGIYTTAKFAVHGLSDALRWSLLPEGIGVSMVCPGLVKSKIYESDLIRPAELSTDVTPADQEFMRILPGLHESGMDPEEIGEKVLRAIRRNDFYVFTHPDHRDELRGIFDEILAAFPDEPVPAQRLAVEEGRRAGKAARPRLLAGRTLGPMEEVAGKTAFVTGGASGIGLGMAEAFVAAGMNVVIADLRADHIATALERFDEGGRRENVHAIELDVTDREGFARAADEAERVFGNVHVLCNNAGMGILGPVNLARYDDWDWGLGVLVGGVVNGIQTFLPRLLAHGEGGHIVNTSSMAGVLPVPGAAIYITAKSAADRALGGAPERARRRGDRRLGLLPRPRADEHPRGRQDAAGAVRRLRLHRARAGARGAAELAALDGPARVRRARARGHPPRRPVHLHAPRVSRRRRRALPGDARLVPGRAAERRAGGGDRLPALQPHLPRRPRASVFLRQAAAAPALAASSFTILLTFPSRADYARSIVRLSYERMDAATPRAAESCAASEPAGRTGTWVRCRGRSEGGAMRPQGSSSSSDGDARPSFSPSQLRLTAIATAVAATRCGSPPQVLNYQVYVGGKGKAKRASRLSRSATSTARAGRRTSTAHRRRA